MKKNVCLVVAILFSCITALNAQNYVWVKKYSSNGDTKIKGITTDFYGNVSLIGMFYKNLSLPPVALTASNNDYENFIAKADSNGNGIWAKSIGASNQNVDIVNICGDDTGNVYVSGTFSTPLQFDGISLNPVSAASNFFYAKYSKTGVIQWAQGMHAKQSGVITPENIHTDKAGNLYISIKFSGRLKFGNDSLQASVSDVFLAKINPSTGALVSYNRIKQKVSNAYTTQLSTDSTGALYVARSFNDTAFIGKTFVKSTGNSDILLAKYVADTLAWVKRFGGKQDDIVTGLNVNKGNGNIFISGKCSDTTMFGTITLSGENHFVLKTDASGNSMWAKSLGTGAIEPTKIVTDKYGRIFVGGSYSGFVNIGTESFSSTFPRSNVFIAHLFDSGSVEWAKSSSSNSSFYFNILSGLSVDNKGSVYFGGWANYSNTFGSYALIGADDYPYGYLGRIKDNGFVAPPPPPPTGVNEMANPKSPFSIYPNPSNGTFSIQLSESLKEGTSIDIVNMLGVYIKTIQVNASDIQQSVVPVNLSELNNGLYYAILQNDGKGQSHQSFIIIK